MSLLLSTCAIDTALAHPTRGPDPPGKPTFEQKAVAALLVAEAGIEKEPGMVAVAEVIRNRAREKNKTPLQIVRQHRIFSSLNGKSLTQLIRKEELHPQFAAALGIAAVLLSHPETLPNTTRNATHFDSVARRPYWAADAKVTTTIGRHRFYRTAY